MKDGWNFGRKKGRRERRGERERERKRERERNWRAHNGLDLLKKEP